MAINFASSLFKPAIFCDNVSRKGYSIQNVISSNSSERIKGYVGKKILNIPVTIVIKFCCNIEISHLILNTGIFGQFKSKLLICTKSDKINMISLENNPGELNSEVMAGMFTRIGKAKNLNAAVFCFKNKMFEAFESFLQPNFDGVLKGAVYQDLLGPDAKSINCVSQVMIQFTLTQEWAIPVLESLEVWGQPSLSCPRPIITSVLELFQSNYAAYFEDTEDDDVFEEKSSTITLDKDTLIGIPTEFIDPITSSLMVMPILLPSYHTIDQVTLDEHIHTEATLGRGPSDPFTGAIFTKKIKPVPNVDLKARLDKYLLSCRNDLKSSILSEEDQEIKWNKEETEIIETERCKKDTEINKKVTESDKKTKMNKREMKISNKDIQEHNKYSKNKRIKIELARKENVDKTNNVNDLDLTELKQISFNQPKCHADILKESLDCALLNVLSNSPLFSKKPSVWQTKLQNLG